MELQEPRCFARNCKHFDGIRERKENDHIVVCPAYPDGIPDRIAYGTELHLTVQEDQVGKIVYERGQR